MPQKKNPDVPELARGKTGRVVGHLMGLITLMKGQPLAYNKDNQEDKEPLFDTVDTLKDTLRIFAEMVGGITVKPEAMEQAALKGYATATDLADYLVKKGLPLPRCARNRGPCGQGRHRAPGRPVGVAAGRAQAVQPDDRKGRVRRAVPARLAERAQHPGGTAPAQVRAQIARHRARLG